MSGAERRGAPRAYTELVLEVMQPDGHLIAGVGRLLDISAKGGRLESALHMDVDQVFRAHVRLENEELLDLPIRVVWRRPRGAGRIYGLEFTEPDAPEVEKVRAWVHERQKQFPVP